MASNSEAEPKKLQMIIHVAAHVLTILDGALAPRGYFSPSLPEFFPRKLILAMRCFFRQHVDRSE